MHHLWAVGNTYQELYTNLRETPSEIMVGIACPSNCTTMYVAVVHVPVFFASKNQMFIIDA